MNTRVESARDGRSRRRTAAPFRRSPAERAARGKAARAEVPRSSHAEWAPAAREDPVAVLEAQAATRVPELAPIRYGRVLVSPFTFFRGSAAMMAGDLSDTPRSGNSVQLCGDAHLSNFGGFASPERALAEFAAAYADQHERDFRALAGAVESGVIGARTDI